MKEHALRVASAAGGPLLALDASTSRASVAAVVPGGAQPPVFELEPDATALPSESLAAAVVSLFEQARLTPEGLHAIVIGLGPGSFTGLRVALALVKGIAYGASLPVYGVSSLALLASRFPGERVAVEIDAQRRELYTALYDVDEDGLPIAVLADRATVREEWSETLARLEHAADRVVGDVEGATRATPRALSGLVLAAAEIESGTGTDLNALVPRYLKVSEAERNLRS